MAFINKFFYKFTFKMFDENLIQLKFIKFLISKKKILLRFIN